MDSVKVTKRDLEVLRTMVRVQLVRTRSLQWVFFPNMGVARRRLRALRDYGLITTHAKGLPGNLAASGGQYWRVTASGLHLVLQTFAGEHEPDNYMTRISGASLRCFEHRDEMTETYLRLIYSQDQNWEEIASRADGLHWLGEYEVELDITEMGASERSRIVPDATLTTKGRRLFLEVDRSTESHARCRRTMKRYASSIRFGHYAKRFPDTLPVVVAYLCKSDKRAQGLQSLMNGLGTLPYEGLAMTSAQATEWLRDQTSSPMPATQEDYLRAELKSASALLQRVYEDYCYAMREQKARGFAVTRSQSLLDAYEFLHTRQSQENP